MKGQPDFRAENSHKHVKMVISELPWWWQLWQGLALVLVSIVQTWNQQSREVRIISNFFCFITNLPHKGYIYSSTVSSHTIEYIKSVKKIWNTIKALSLGNCNLFPWNPLHKHVESRTGNIITSIARKPLKRATGPNHPGHMHLYTEFILLFLLRMCRIYIYTSISAKAVKQKLYFCSWSISLWKVEHNPVKNRPKKTLWKNILVTKRNTNIQLSRYPTKQNYTFNIFRRKSHYCISNQTYCRQNQNVQTHS